MEKFNEAYKATLAVFHGIIATWLFLTFSERSADQFQFLILLVFFAVANLLVWHAISNVIRLAALRSEIIVGPKLELAAIQYRATDVVGLLIVAITVGLGSAYIDRNDWVLRAANKVADWNRTGSDSPFVSMIANITGHQAQLIDKREPQFVTAAGGAAYLRVYLKDLRIGYEGYPGRAPTKSEVREVILTPACRFFIDANDSSKNSPMTRIEGPGVFLRLVDTSVIEIIDMRQSACANLP